MKKQNCINYFSWFSIIIGTLHFIIETWFHFEFGQSIIQLIADYLGILLLVFGGIIVLENNKGIGLLCGAWGYIFCLNYRAFAWRMDKFTIGNSTDLIDQTIILGITLIFSLAAFLYSLMLCYPSKKK